jgi:hypothetical protein
MMIMAMIKMVMIFYGGCDDVICDDDYDGG